MEVGIIKGIIKESRNNWRFLIESPLHDVINYRAGQLIQLGVHSKRWGELVRSYSLSSWPNGSNILELIVTRVEDGKMTDYLFNEAVVGDEVLFRGPMGTFLLPDDMTGRDIFMVATGSGISPFRSMINWIGENQVPFSRIKLFFGCRYEEDLLYRAEMERWARELAGFEYLPTLSRGNWTGLQGYVHQHYLSRLEDTKPLIYFCGWERMINEGRLHVKGLGYELGNDIKVEIFG
jgi:NAD(P)H-flavin reductase